MGFSLTKTIHFGVPPFLDTPIYEKKNRIEYPQNMKADHAFSDQRSPKNEGGGYMKI